MLLELHLPEFRAFETISLLRDSIYPGKGTIGAMSVVVDLGNLLELRDNVQISNVRHLSHDILRPLEVDNRVACQNLVDIHKIQESHWRENIYPGTFGLGAKPIVVSLLKVHKSCYYITQ